MIWFVCFWLSVFFTLVVWFLIKIINNVFDR
jgi:hypothetical protein